MDTAPAEACGQRDRPYAGPRGPCVWSNAYVSPAGGALPATWRGAGAIANAPMEAVPPRSRLAAW